MIATHIEIYPSPATLRFASVLTHSDSRRIYGSLTLAQISPYGETSHIPETLGESAKMVEKIWMLQRG